MAFVNTALRSGVQSGDQTSQERAKAHLKQIFYKSQQIGASNIHKEASFDELCRVFEIDDGEIDHQYFTTHFRQDFPSIMRALFADPSRHEEAIRFSRAMFHLYHTYTGHMMRDQELPHNIKVGRLGILARVQHDIAKTHNAAMEALHPSHAHAINTNWHGHDDRDRHHDHTLDYRKEEHHGTPLPHSSISHQFLNTTVPTRPQPSQSTKGLKPSLDDLAQRYFDNTQSLAPIADKVIAHHEYYITKEEHDALVARHQRAQSAIPVPPPPVFSPGMGANDNTDRQLVARGTYLRPV